MQSRLLYRGALSLPDSHLLLDGLTFFARASSQTGFNDLLQSPLALALESMRGRPSLRFIGVVTMKDVWIDENGNVSVDIHPEATISRIYFENMFCLTPFASIPTPDKPSARSDSGIQIALGDSDGSETTHIVIYAQTLPGSPHTLHFCVGRITPPPPPPGVSTSRLPRPDDPTPRVPPPILTRTGQLRAERERMKRAVSISESVANKRAKLSGSASLGSLGDSSKAKKQDWQETEEPVFKVPNVPSAKTRKGKPRDMSQDTDVFGPDVASSIPEKRQGKEKEKETEVEKSNKLMIKQTAVHRLTTGLPANGTLPIPCPPIAKAHPEFKDIMGWVYRGVGYALRSDLKTVPVDPAVVDQLVQCHVRMYTPPLFQHGTSTDDVR